METEHFDTFANTQEPVAIEDVLRTANCYEGSNGFEVNYKDCERINASYQLYAAAPQVVQEEGAQWKSSLEYVCQCVGSRFVSQDPRLTIKNLLDKYAKDKHGIAINKLRQLGYSYEGGDWKLQSDAQQSISLLQRIDDEYCASGDLSMTTLNMIRAAIAAKSTASQRKHS